MTDQIKKLERQIEELTKLQETQKDVVSVWWFYAGKIALLFEQIAELNRAKDGRKQPEIHY